MFTMLSQDYDKHARLSMGWKIFTRSLLSESELNAFTIALYTDGGYGGKLAALPHCQGKFGKYKEMLDLPPMLDGNVPSLKWTWLWWRQMETIFLRLSTWPGVVCQLSTCYKKQDKMLSPWIELTVDWGIFTVKNIFAIAPKCENFSRNFFGSKQLSQQIITVL